MHLVKLQRILVQISKCTCICLNLKFKCNSYDQMRPLEIAQTKVFCPLWVITGEKIGFLRNTTKIQDLILGNNSILQERLDHKLWQQYVQQRHVNYSKGVVFSFAWKWLEYWLQNFTLPNNWPNNCWHFILNLLKVFWCLVDKTGHTVCPTSCEGTLEKFRI